MTAPELWSNRFVGVDYLDEDRGWAGTHCYGGVRLVFREDHGLELQDYGPARDRHHNGLWLRSGAALRPWIDVTSKALRTPLERRPYDVVVFTVNGIDDHCGIVATPAEMLHWSHRVGYARHDRIDALGFGRLSAVYRHEALAGREDLR